jgi:hypothetical protein
LVQDHLDQYLSVQYIFILGQNLEDKNYYAVKLVNKNNYSFSKKKGKDKVNFSIKSNFIKFFKESVIFIAKNLAGISSLYDFGTES